ncbi:MAG: SIS domain-containing protein [Planctomycetota bacterium]|nr:SIS domain-containing protein [Planctomycetota bacterium]
MNRFDIKKLAEQYENPLVKEIVENQFYMVIRVINKILSADRIFICGNGGSMSTANHLALDWSKAGGKQAISLCSPEIISAYANDTGYESCFTGQLQRFNITKQDIIILVSYSGESNNIKKVIDVFPSDNIIGFTSNRRSCLSEKSNMIIKVVSKNIRIVEDAHLGFGHFITEIMEKNNVKNRNAVDQK